MKLIYNLVSLSAIIAGDIAFSPALAEAQFDDPRLTYEWRSSQVDMFNGLFQVKYKLQFKVDHAMLFTMDVVTTTPYGSGGYRYEFEGEYQTATEGHLDITVSGTFLTPLSENTALTANNDTLCGLDGWQFGARRNVSSLDCRFFTAYKSGHIIRDRYEFRGTEQYLYLGTNLARDIFIKEPDVDRDDHGRPIMISDKVGLAKSGVLPPAVNQTAVDELSGLYEVIDYFENSVSCESAGQSAATKAKYVYFFPLSTVIPYAPGWLSKECTARAGCDKGGIFNAGGPWNVFYFDEKKETWWGNSDQLMTYGPKCKGKRNHVEVNRLANGDLEAMSTRHSILIEQAASRWSDPLKACAITEEVKRAFEQSECLSRRSVVLRRITSVP